VPPCEQGADQRSSATLTNDFVERTRFCPDSNRTRSGRQQKGPQSLQAQFSLNGSQMPSPLQTLQSGSKSHSGQMQSEKPHWPVHPAHWQKPGNGQPPGGGPGIALGSRQVGVPPPPPLGAPPLGTPPPLGAPPLGVAPPLDAPATPPVGVPPTPPDGAPPLPPLGVPPPPQVLQTSSVNLSVDPSLISAAPPVPPSSDWRGKSSTEHATSTPAAPSKTRKFTVDLAKRADATIARVLAVSGRCPNGVRIGRPRASRNPRTLRTKALA
jgi:hypothetical protein